MERMRQGCAWVFVACAFLAIAVPGLRTLAFGSDELQPYSAKYTWLANQVAHFAVGFVAMIAYWTIYVNGRSRWWAVVPFLIVLSKDFVVDSVVDVCAAHGSPVQPNWWPVLFDSLTDDLFWFSGFLLALVAVGFHAPAQLSFWKSLVGCLVCVAAALGCGGYWVAQKDSFDRSGMPLNFARLTHIARYLRFPEAKREAQSAALRDIQDRARKGESCHVIIFGGDPKRRTDLAVSVGCEYVFPLAPNGPWGLSGPTTVVQTSAARLLEDGRAAPDSKDVVKRSPAWPPLDAGTLRCLVVTDLDTSMAPPPDKLIEAAIAARRPDIIGGGVNNQLDLATFLNIERKGALKYDRNTPLTLQDLDALRQYGKKLTFPRVDELNKVALNRTRPLRQLATELQAKGVATVWSFAETPAWLGAACDDDATEQRHRKSDRDAWAHTLAALLGVGVDTLILLELESP